LLLIK
jgi:hypothetical protein